jgi:hypothetical protein
VSASGEPLRKVNLALRGSSVFTVESTLAGVFAFESVPPGKYVLSASRNGYLTQTGSKAITVAAGQSVSGVNVILAPQGVVTGKIFDEDGDPILGATVSLLSETPFRGRKSFVIRSSETTNDMGEYRMAAVPPGRYFLAVDAKSEALSANHKFVTTYFPGVYDQTQATPVQVEAGQQLRGINIALRPTSVVNVQGRVIDLAGDPALNMQVTLSREQAALLRL